MTPKSNFTKLQVVGTAIANPTVAARSGQYYIAGQQVPAYQQQQPVAQNSTQIRTPNPLNPTRINIHNPTPTRHPQNLSTQIHQQNPALFQQNQQPQNPTTIPSPIRILQNPKRTTAGFQSSQNSAFSNYNYRVSKLREVLRSFLELPMNVSESST